MQRIYFFFSLLKRDHHFQIAFLLRWKQKEEKVDEDVALIFCFQDLQEERYGLG